jgi:hypothetical protein
LLLTLIADLASVQVDYTNALAQAGIREEVYIEIPEGYALSNLDQVVVLMLKNPPYGLVQATIPFIITLSATYANAIWSLLRTLSPIYGLTKHLSYWL